LQLERREQEHHEQQSDDALRLHQFLLKTKYMERMGSRARHFRDTDIP
jgi:hypothetical protein